MMFDAIFVCRRCGCIFITGRNNDIPCPNCKHYFREVVMTKPVNKELKEIIVILKEFENYVGIINENN